MSGFENVTFNLNYLQAMWIIWLSCPKVALSLRDKRRAEEASSKLPDYVNIP